jgi:hypothetical protein
MSDSYRAKLSELTMEFTHYLIQHPEFSARISDDAQVVLLDRHDPMYSQQATEFAQRAKATDDVTNRPVVSVEVGELNRLAARLSTYEQRYGMASDEFYRRFRSGELGDAFDFVEWSIFLEMYQAAEKRLHGQDPGIFLES